MIRNLCVLFVLGLIFVVTQGQGGCGKKHSDDPPPPDGPTQGWTLTNDAGDVAYVIVKPFTYCGTFTEASNSPGWWLYDSFSRKVARIPVSGSICHAGGYDTWDFTMTVSGGGMMVTAQGTGKTTDGIYPSAQHVTGTIDGTATSPAGSQHVHNTWGGNDVTKWNKIDLTDDQVE
jgi:hypothetical protein